LFVAVPAVASLKLRRDINGACLNQLRQRQQTLVGNLDYGGLLGLTKLSY
jgi:hypothetical protein